MEATQQKILFVGDNTDSWIEGIDQLYRQAVSMPWLQTFLEDIFQAAKDEIKERDHVLRDSIADCSSLLELANRYRHEADEVGMAHAILVHALRAAMLLQWVKREPQLVSATGPKPENLGISGGLANLCAVAVATDFASLYAAVLEVARVFFRLCIITSVRSRAIEDRPGSWGCAVIGIAPDELRKVLEQFQQSMGVPPIKRAKVAITGDRWCTVIGPPTVLELIIKQCPALKSLPKDKLNIFALQHCVTVSQVDIDYIIGCSALLDKPVLPNFRLWGMDDPKATYASWGNLLRAMALQVISVPLDITKVVGQLNSWLGSQHLDVKVMGPSSHTAYLASILKAAGSTASFQTDESLEETCMPSPGRIAIVGMAGRGPSSDNLEEFWNIIMSKKDLAEEIPKDRFDIDEFYCAEHKDTCTSTTRFGCFMNKPGNFDSRFFRVSPREALLMDPCHRQFLMSTYEALEMAGYSDGQTRATDPRKIAAFFGQSTDDWHMVTHHELGCDSYTLQGIQRAFGAGRIAYQFKWEGPTYSLDSACASSVAAVHLASMSLRAKDIDMAVVGAANINTWPHSWTGLSKSGVLSDTGNCKTYRDDADGYCRADFAGTVILKRLEDAVAQNDNILAVVAGSGRNHSGNSTSITTSDAGAQERLFQKVLNSSRISPHDISYVEMHGTGTQVGDPAEMGAIASIFKHRQGHGPLTVGGVKANVGHSEAAAGMASLLKCLLMFQKDVMPPQAGMPHALNPKYPSLSELGIDIPSEPKEFKPMDHKPRRILLNNFDAAGGNACMLLEDYSVVVKQGVDPRSSHVIVTSGKTKASYLANKRNLLEWLRANENANIQDIAYTTTARRMHHLIRFACTASTTRELIGKLEQDTVDAALSPVSSIIFVFTGQGSHYAGMGSELYATCRPFRETIDLCASICEEHGFPPFLDIITNKDTDVSTKDTLQTQLAVVTLEVGLASFWRSCGIQPAMAIGHSLGEYAALHVCGVLSLADMLYLIGHRARLLSERCEANACAMLATKMSAAAVHDILDTKPHLSCAVACLNSPDATVVSGSADDIAEFQKSLTSPSKLLSVPYGFHSFQMDPMVDDYIALAGGVTYSTPKIPVASTLLGSVVEAPGIFNGHYLGRQTRHPVNFVGALNAVRDKLGDPIWLEIGPSPVCSSFVRATLSPSSSKIMSSLESNTNAWTTISKCLAGAYTNGVSIDWLALHAPFTDALTLLTLPSYAWDLKDFWLTYTEKDKALNSVSTLAPAREISTCAQHVVQESTTPKLSVTLRASIANPGFKALVDGHRLRGVSVVPGSVFCEAAAAAAKYTLHYSKRQDAESIRFTVKDVSLKRPLTRSLVGSEGELLTTVLTDTSSSNRLHVSWKASSQRSSYDLGSCLVTVTDANDLQSNWDRISYFIKGRMNELIRIAKDGNGHRMLPGILYSLFANTVEYDPAFKCIKEAFISSDFAEAAAEIVLCNNPHGTQFVSSPYWGESLVHLAGFLVNGNTDRLGAKTTFMMDSFDSLEQTVDMEPGKPYYTYVRISQRDKTTTCCDVYVFDTEKLVMQCSALRFHEVSNAILDQLLGKSATSSQVQGKDTIKPTPSPEPIGLGPSPQSRSNFQKDAPKVAETAASTGEENTTSNNEVLEAILDSISKGTGTEIADLTDDTVLVDLGIDSIMGIEITTNVNNSTGTDMLPSFLLDYHTIGNLRNAFAKSQTSTPHSEPSSDFSMIESTPRSTDGASTPFINGTAAISDDTSKKNASSSEVEEDTVMVSSPAEDDSPAPSTRPILLHGRPSSGKRPFYLIADGTGSIATYIHLAPLSSNIPVYGIDSPFLRCPSRLTTEVGFPGVAKIIVEALIKFQPEGPFSIGGFSGGAMISYEVCRQLAAAGRTVESLLLIDMCSPRPVGLQKSTLYGWRVYESIANVDGRWNVSNSTQQHMRGIFACVASYHPPPMKPQERPLRTAIIWAKKGSIHRCSGDHELRKMLAEADIPTEPFPGFMEDPRMGEVGWSLPDKTPADLGPNGWDRYVGEAKCVSVDADHLEMPMPGHVHLLHGAMEEMLPYLRPES
ncbi:uncharacterized protein K452DRAFT_266997 [Aplosporella prunicola CBS 121167]|uniref:Uncharacterized protein n=1 Tax=Aplosporella prunicola CBS 121167 TaxID=1176127 RepID=A0A6A6BKP2_9PEZI|nr:uncharacterized protein K452DRAFT_266997 [Aplosporella prunicola CBS 121167]KAF2143953.1 hypothetical protein K452DRAFT_266997 [Aplosporella prunicola CBS 121167]